MFRILVGIVVFLAATSAAAWFTLRRGDIPFEALETTYEGYASDYYELPGGVRMHYRDEGPGDSDRVLVLVHGYGASLHTWEPWVRRLDGEYRLISLDLPAHGLTRTPEDHVASIEDSVMQVRALTQALNLDKFVLAGSSMGGNVAWNYALEHPEDLEGLVLVAASGWPEADGADADDTLLIRLAKNPMIGPFLVEIDTTDQVRTVLEASFVDQEFVTEESVRMYSELSRAPGHRKGLMDLLTQSPAPATHEALSAIKAPTLILHGDQDKLISVDGARLFEEAIARTTLVVYEDIGHLPQEEAPGESANDLRAFLNSVYSGIGAPDDGPSTVELEPEPASAP